MYIKKIVSEFKNIFQKSSINNQVKFNLTNHDISNVFASSASSITNIINSIGIKPGLYVFYARKLIISPAFISGWDSNPLRHQCKFPNKKYNQNGENIAIYIGTAKNLNQRISEHLSNNQISSTRKLLLLDPQLLTFFNNVKVNLLVFHFNNMNSIQYKVLSGNSNSIEANLIRNIRTFANYKYNK